MVPAELEPHCVLQSVRISGGLAKQHRLYKQNIKILEIHGKTPWKNKIKIHGKTQLKKKIIK